MRVIPAIAFRRRMHGIVMIMRRMACVLGLSRVRVVIVDMMRVVRMIVVTMGRVVAA